MEESKEKEERIPQPKEKLCSICKGSCKNIREKVKINEFSVTYCYETMLVLDYDPIK